MKPRLSAFVLLFALACAQAGPLKPEIDSHEEAFHWKLHKSPETYLVCYYDVQKKPWGKEFEQLEIKATVVAVVRGNRAVGDKLSFTRTLDGKYGDLSPLQGSLKYVHYYKVEAEGTPEHGKLIIDPQDPHSVFSYDPKLAALAKEHTEAPGHKAAGPAKTSKPVKR